MYLKLPEFTWIYPNLPKFTWIYQDWFFWVHLGSLGFKLLVLCWSGLILVDLESYWRLWVHTYPIRFNKWLFEWLNFQEEPKTLTHRNSQTRGFLCLNTTFLRMYTSISNPTLPLAFFLGKMVLIHDNMFGPKVYVFIF